MAKNLENNLIHANANYINFDEHRAEYTAHYDALRKEIYGHWKGHETLGKLVNGYTLGGRCRSQFAISSVYPRLGVRVPK